MEKIKITIDEAGAKLILFIVLASLQSQPTSIPQKKNKSIIANFRKRFVNLTFKKKKAKVSFHYHEAATLYECLSECCPDDPLYEANRQQIMADIGAKL